MWYNCCINGLFQCKPYETKRYAAIDRDHSLEMMNTIVELREKYDLYSTIERYIPDGNGIPAKTGRFIIY
jgi:hypothetical protein